jgi:Arc/MetJ-type ribon-helix-helix transcriptional regulator
MVKDIDNWVAGGRFASRSEAIKTIVALYNERERIRKFYQVLSTRSDEAEQYPENLISLEKVLA